MKFDLLQGKTATEEKTALIPQNLQLSLVKAILDFTLVLKAIEVYGPHELKVEEYFDFVSTESFFYELMSEDIDFMQLTEGEREAVRIFENYLRKRYEPSDAFMFWMLVRDRLGREFWVSNKLEDLERAKRQYNRPPDLEIRDIKILPTKRVALRVGEVIVKTTKRMGLLSILKFRRPKPILRR